MAVRGRAIVPTAGVALFALLTAAPLFWMVAVSLMPKGAADQYPPPLWPTHPTLANYAELLRPNALHGGEASGYGLLPAIGNSLLLASLNTLIGLAFAVPAGYALSKLRFRGRSLVLRFMLALAVLPPPIGMLPLFLLLRWAGLVNTYAGVLAPALANAYGVLFIRQATLAIPDEMLDAARLDGASEWALFRRIALPLLRPGVLTLALFTFLASWSDFLWPLIVITDGRRATLPLALAAISREHGQDVELMMAGAVITTVPVLLLFLALQRRYFAGLLSGGIKG